MSYNITKWKITHVFLNLPLAFDFQAWVAGLPDKDEDGYENWGKRFAQEAPRAQIQCNLVAETWVLDVSGQTLTGSIHGNRLVLDTAQSLNWTGDGSGHLYRDILLPFFCEHGGELEAIVVWEHGDTIKRVTILEGVVTEEEIT